MKTTDKTCYKVDLDRAVDVYGDLVYRVAVTVTKNESDAQDVFQETYLRLVKYRTAIESEEHLRAWLIRTASNCAKSMVTNHWNTHTQGLDECARTQEICVTGEEDRFLELIHSLPPQYGEALYLFYYEEYSIREIAEILQKKENTIKSLLARGRRRIEKKLEKEGYRGI